MGPAGLGQDHDRRLQPVVTNVLVADLLGGAPPDLLELRADVELALHGERPGLDELAEFRRLAAQRLRPDSGIAELELVELNGHLRHSSVLSGRLPTVLFYYTIYVYICQY